MFNNYDDDYGSFFDPGDGGVGQPPPPPSTPPPLGAPLIPPVGGNYQLGYPQLTNPGGGHGGGGGFGGGGFDPGSFPDYDFGPLPVFHAPKFVAPTTEEVLSSPDYQSRLRSGTDALERSAAARGTLRTGGTLKDVIDYGKKFGQGEYDTSFNHALQGYEANYRGAHDEFAPQLAGYQMRAQAALARALAIYGRGTSWNDPHGNGGGGGGGGVPDNEPFWGGFGN